MELLLLLLCVRWVSMSQLTASVENDQQCTCMSQMSCSQRFKNNMSLFLHETRECVTSRQPQTHEQTSSATLHVRGIPAVAGPTRITTRATKLIGQYRCGGAEKQRVNLYSSN